MKIVSDAGMDLSAEQLEGLEIYSIPLTFVLDGKTYRSGIDIQPGEFYELLEATDSFPTTSQPSPGEFAEIYRRVAAEDPEILSVHVSGGLSGTLNAAREGAELVPEAHVTLVDTKTLSAAEGWQVEAAARAAKAGWSVEQTLPLLDKIRELTDAVYTLATLKYLIHGGRISHLTGLLASMLNIKPIIGVDKETGKYYQRGRMRTLDKAILKIADLVAEQYKPGVAMRFQMLHGNNLKGALLLKERLAELFDCTWLPTNSIAPVFGAHTGSGLVGLIYAPMAGFPDMP